jgi:hypothetical protein
VTEAVIDRITGGVLAGGGGPLGPVGGEQALSTSSSPTDPADRREIRSRNRCTRGRCLIV